MSSKRRHQNVRSGGPASDPGPNRGLSQAPRPAGLPTDTQGRLGLLIFVLVLAAIVVMGTDYLFGAVAGGGSAQSPAATPGPAASSFGVVVPGNGGSWTNVSPDQLAGMLAHKDFILIDVQTPYIGEIDGTGLYIPYDQIPARASELPASRATKILVYCRSGVQSAQAAQALLDLGYTNIWNLDGGMNAWQAAGRALVNKNR